MKFVPLPPEFSALEGRVQWVQRVNDNEYTSSCPNCGIDPAKHSDARPSDRFIMWIESRENGKPFAMCFRGCKYKWTPNKEDAVWSDEEKAAFAAKRREMNEREEERIRKYAEDVVMKQAFYDKCHETLKVSKYAAQYMRARRLDSVDWLAFWKFGLIEDFKCRGYTATYYSPAITIPVGFGNIVEQIKMRVTEATHEKDRFRNIYKTKAQHVFLPCKEEKLDGVVAVFEGEFKAAQVAMRGGLPKTVKIVGAQGKGLGMRLIYALEQAEVVYLCLDPDAFIKPEKGESTIIQTARRIGFERVRIIPVKQKVDDAILQGFNLLNAFNMAVKPSQIGI